MSMKVPFDEVFPKIIGVLEKKWGKSDEKCEIPEEINNASEYKSVFLQFFKLLT